MDKQSIIKPEKIAAEQTVLWSPRIIGEIGDTYIKVARVQGEFVWHSHENEDELFYILDGQLRIELETGDVELSAGDLFIVPRGVRHRPVAGEECRLMLIERKTTRHTGNEKTPLTRSIEEQLAG
jgi:mannose-6-phosphate isomerase-like protein (cupin superfamily)